ncbi:transcription factor bHLH162-like [Benincasa hispida]|uniref:transcription factor bHLH162-like n=1 Tax=Benincasa hispida TaxID=102211 RepID=UPI001901CDAD|nr:transcription factor bHLH162-like [Benincasa hispida]XP_038876952.1 transcription factor bHLH162-like [Benincasa hispida]XP_038876954.1 transcription factor bHLH162-like [Benincasa hispida]XP_038876955.1 transcription factor bHLH162-like [Benincasa hispida]XP_038876956.1 transcription factor bHLH162-like [Benincasa hispida]
MANNPICCPPSKLIERNGRREMKALFSTLNSLLPNQNSGEARTVPDQLEEATNYIKELQNNIERLKEKKEKLKQKQKVKGKYKMGVEEDEKRRKCKHEIEPNLLLQVKAHRVGSSVEVFLTTGISDYHFILQQIIRLLQHNGAHILNLNQSILQHRAFHKITAQVDGEGMVPEDGERICETVKNFVSQYKDGQCSLK